MPTRSAEEYRDDARMFRILADQAVDEDTSKSLLGLALLCQYLAQRLGGLKQQGDPAQAVAAINSTTAV